MVYDDDTHDRDPGHIDPFDEPLELTPPRDVATREAILAVARAFPAWGRLAVHDKLERDGRGIPEAVVNYVLASYRMPHLLR